MKSDLQAQVNEAMDYAVYLQFIGSFDLSLDFSMTKQISIDIYDFLKTATATELHLKLPKIKHTLEAMTSLAVKKYPPKVEIATIASEWNGLFKDNRDFFSYGVEYGWASRLMDLSNIGLYQQYVPYTMKIGLGANKGHFSIEEDFLLKDSFNILLNCKYSKDVLDKYASRIKKSGLFDNKKYNREIYTNFSNLKFDIASNARLSIISFYSFVECFINSVGYSYLMYNQMALDESSKELLKGKVKNRYISLKDKIRQFPSVIRQGQDSQKRHFDANDQKFFEIYEQLRNSSVHYSPLKDDIWLKSDVWLEKAKEFSEIALLIAMRFWTDCYSGEPEYLGKLEYNRLYTEAESKLAVKRQIESGGYLVEPEDS